MSRFIKLPFVTVSILALAACAAGEAPAAEPSADAADTETTDTAMDDSKPADSPPAGQSQRITIRGFECGDNCYLDYSLIAPATGADPVEETQSALCSVDACLQWFEEQAVPPEFVGRSATVTIGIGKQYDNAGTVMSDDFPLITSITVDPAK